MVVRLPANPDGLPEVLPLADAWVYWVESGEALASRPQPLGSAPSAPTTARGGQWVRRRHLRLHDVIIHADGVRARVVALQDDVDTLPTLERVPSEEELAATRQPFVIRATDGHPWYVKDKGWTATKDLRPGDRLLTDTGSTIRVTEVSDNGDVEPVFNLQVLEAHTYYVGLENGPFVLIHNESPAAREDTGPVPANGIIFTGSGYSGGTIVKPGDLQDRGGPQDATHGKGLANATNTTQKVIIAIDGTESRAFTNDPSYRDPATNRPNSFVKNFQEDAAGAPSFGASDVAAYWHGPDSIANLARAAGECEFTCQGVVNYVKGVLATNPKAQINMVGHSRGGVIAMEAARRLGEEGIKVNFLGLYDPVDMAVGFSASDNISDNVKNAAVVTVFDESGSRPGFRRVAGHVDDPTKTAYNVNLVFASHGGTGGAVAGESDVFNNVRKDIDMAEGSRGDAWMRKQARAAGVELVPSPREATVADINRPGPAAQDRLTFRQDLRN
jgi:pimeloyl-ACP methyl ester carboxylesterase